MRWKKVKLIEGSKRMSYDRQYKDEDLNLYYRVQLTEDENEFILGNKNIERKAIKYEISPANKKKDIISVYPINLEVELDG